MTPTIRYTGDDDVDDAETLGARPRRKPRAIPQRGAEPTIAATAAAGEVTDLADPDAAFVTSYTPARFERAWLAESLRPFYAERSIVDVLALVKGGKEANVYCCRAHPALGGGLVAAKVYRPRQFRNLSNDTLYREGRATLGADGAVIKKSDSRVARALSNRKSDYGVEVKHASWLMHEFGVLTTLHRAGVPVPEPIAAGENAILMGYYGEESAAAPTLNGVRLERDEAAGLLESTLAAIAGMLDQKLIHGDLSAYNILYWEGQIAIIDLPQAVDCHVNPRAFALLRRDLTRVCDYFARQGVARDPLALTERLWYQHVALDIDEQERYARLR